jgi:hypothetical protein
MLERWLACAVACSAASVAVADDDVSSAPPPGGESGRTDVVDGGDSTARVIGRGALFVPKLVVTLALAPERGAIWAYDRYQLKDLFYRVFYNDAKTIGVYPILTYESSFGPKAGVHFEDLDVWGARERIAVDAAAGIKSYSFLAEGALRSGDRFGRLELGLDGRFARRPDDPFFGIGNGDTTMAPAMAIDPRVDETAVHTKFRWQEARAAAWADVRVVGDLHLSGRSALSERRFSRSDSGPPIDEVFDPAGLVDFSGGVRQLVDEGELRFDSRRPRSEWEGPVRSSGTLALVSLGRVTRLDDGSDYWRYGAELQQFLRIAKGPRLLSLRVRGDAVSGSVDEVPFLELPSLGGSVFLRGYDTGRFRDRAAAVASLTYEWDLSRFTAAYVFTDAGRVFPSLDDLTLEDMRVGYGVGLELHSYNRYLLEGTIASSIDGGVFFNLSFNPVLDQQPRWR